LNGLPSLRAKPNNPQAEQNAFAAAYRDGLGLACIAVRCTSAGITISSVGEDRAGFAARWWCRRAADAARIAASMRAKMRRRESDTRSVAAAGDSWVDCDSQEMSFACTALADVARRLGVALFSDDDIAAHAAEIAARIDAELQKLKDSGGLKSVNQAYKAYRLETSGRGERVLRYDEWMRRYRADLVRQAAAALREL
jgi:hypothetical protein